MDSRAQSACAFAVNNADLPKTLIMAGLNIFRDKILYFLRAEGMQVEHAGDGKGNGIVHASNVQSSVFSIQSSLLARRKLSPTFVTAQCGKDETG